MNDEEEIERVYAIAYNRRVYLEWCFETGVDYESMTYVPDGKWLAKHGEPGLRFKLTRRWEDRRDWETILDALTDLRAVNVDSRD